MKVNEVLKELKNLGTDQNIKIYKNHGADLEVFGVSMANIKSLYKKLKNNHELGLALLETRNIDAMYLGHFMVDSSLLTKDYLEAILQDTNYYLIIENVVAKMAAKNYELGLVCLESWLRHQDHRFRQAAYSILSYMLMEYPNDQLDIDFIQEELDYVKNHLQDEENRVRYTMNGFLISAGIYIKDYTSICKDYAKVIGKVEVNMGNTACKVPDAYSYILKVEKMDKIGYKRKIN